MTKGATVKSALSTLLIAVMLLSGCANEQVSVARVHHRNRVSPAAVSPPDYPADAFDQAKAAELLLASQRAREQGDLAGARQTLESALALWPVATEGWEALMEICKAQQDSGCQAYARFFHAKLLMLSGLPMRAASMGFETVAENPEGTKVDSLVYDRRLLAMAERLWVFCSKEDPSHAKAAEPTEPSFYESYPYAPALLVIGIGAGILTGINAVAK
jgi:hypothetical protein